MSLKNVSVRSFRCGHLIAAAALAGLSGCTMGPNFMRPNWASPASWFAGPKEAVKQPPSIPVAQPIDPNWWTLFHDPELTKLERRVASENLDVKVAAIRFAESRAQLSITRAALYPSLNANASYARELPSNNGLFALVPGAAGASAASGAQGTSTAASSGRDSSQSTSIRAASMRRGRLICGARYSARSKPARRPPKPPRMPGAPRCSAAWPKLHAITSGFAVFRRRCRLRMRTWARHARA